MARKLKSQYNRYELEKYDYGICYISNKEVLFDLEDYERIKSYSWKCVHSQNGYQTIVSYTKENIVVMSRVIMNCYDKKLQVYHINHNTFDNRKSNLRIVTVSQNNMNKGLRRDNTTGYTGVIWSNASGKYLANIKINQKRIHLGTFSKIEDAVRARREAEEKYFGEYRFNESLTNKK